MQSKKKWRIASLIFVALFFVMGARTTDASSIHQANEFTLESKTLPTEMNRFVTGSGLKFKYPDAVRGIYVTSHAAGGPKLNQLIDYMGQTDLNAMVIDVKDDWGNLTYKPRDLSSPYVNIGKNYIKDPMGMLKQLERSEIYPIARIVVFKDSYLANKKPKWSFVEDGEVWKNRHGDSFVNPFLQEVWDYNIGIAIEVAKMGFQEIQFDYVRFPEGFEKRDSILTYGLGGYENRKFNPTQKRVQAVTDFVAYAKDKLSPYGVKMSVDIFGYAATLPEAPGIGQNFSQISEHVDVISSMIYPSHWSSYFGINKPDLEPYKLVSEYSKLENKKLATLKNPPISRPWLQDFTAAYLGKGNYQKYEKEQVEAQIKALKDQGINEYLLWNAGNNYTPGVNYNP